MDFSGRFPVDLVLFALIAVFLVLRLRSVLGRKVGFQPGMTRPVPAPEAPGPVVEAQAEPVKNAAFDIPAPNTRLGQILSSLVGLDASFVPQQFLIGVEGAFRQVVTAFAAGDRSTLQARLTPEAFAAFDSAITSREQAGETQRSEIRAVHTLAIQDVRQKSLEAGTAVEIDVRIVSDQISMTLDKDGQPSAGTDAVTEFSDLWTFVRLFSGSGNSAWRLAAARSA
ncbi:MAG: Tim44 domain-containing protein [Acetobacter sp.]|jgi:predicted lipid-binding transport protein (Tim44 family)|nr:Tim44 domain-containing protein [Acetobacter sp.]